MNFIDKPIISFVFIDQVNQLHMMLDKAERTTQDIITKYDNEMQKLIHQVNIY